MTGEEHFESLANRKGEKIEIALLLMSLSLLRSEDSNKRPPGTPGTPGSRDLEAALRRLSLRRDNYLSEKRFFEEERERKLAYLGKEDEKGEAEGSGGPGSPTESLLSFCSHPSFGSIWSGYSITARSYLPEKLQIVKPLEGDYWSNDPLDTNKEKKNRSFQNVFLNSNENSNRKENHNQKQRQDYNYVFLSSSNSETQISPTQGNDSKHPNRYLIFHNQSESQILPSASPNVKLRRSSSLLEIRSLSGLQPPLRAPLALGSGLLTALRQEGGTLNLQHSFYFRHTQPRCWFEV